MRPMTRQCARPGCAHQAVATLEYDYRGQTGWLHRLSPEAHPMTHDLCPDHAARLSLPRGWRLEDLRMVAALVQPRPAEVAGQIAS